MILLRRFGSSAAFTLGLFFLVFPVKPSLAGGQIELKYLVTYLHVTVGAGQWSLDLDQDRYVTAASGQIAGMMTLLINGNGSGRAEGHIVRGVPQPDRFAAHVASSAENDDVTMSFQDGAIRDFQALPPFPPTPKRVTITSELLEGASDPLSAAFIPLNHKSEIDPCSEHLRIFDGRRRYDVTLQLKRSEKVSIEPGYRGVGIVCSVQVVPIAGQQTEESAVRFLADTKDDIEIEYAFIEEAQAFVPIAGTIPTLVGTLHVNAQRITIQTSDIKKPRL
jgi:hypothetical protein